MTEYGNRLNVEHRQAENDYKRAVELGDPDATLEAQRKLTELSIQANQYTQAQQAAQQRQQYEQQYAQQATQQPAQPAQPQAPDPKAEEWAKKNEWFGQDEAMTFAAFGVHKKLVEDEGFDPQSDDYYNELDNRMRDEFPHKLNNTGSERRPAQTVAGVSRSTTGRTNSKRVKLSPTQVAIAKKLGVPLEEYAKYVRD
jgi:flagellar biosynthesis GTPase FlhF